MNRSILITGFDPFGGETINPAFEAVRMLPDELAGFKLCKLEIPTEFLAGSRALLAALASERPAAVVCVGQAGGRTAITPERVAINLMDARIADNAGFQPVDLPVVPGGPAAYFSTLPIKKIAERIQRAGLPAAVSNTAGTYVCNSLFYTLLHTAAREYPALRGGFIHVPYAEQQLSGKPAGTFGMALSDIAAGLRCAVETIAEVLTEEMDLESKNDNY